MSTTPRAIRIPSSLWRAALAKAKSEGTTVTAVVIAALRQFVASAVLLGCLPWQIQRRQRRSVRQPGRHAEL
jgi:hypothetical protein